MEAMGLLPEGEGSEYIPQYLLNDERAGEIQNQGQPQQPQQQGVI
jgi:hypothetical protein